MQGIPQWIFEEFTLYLLYSDFLCSFLSLLNNNNYYKKIYKAR